MSVSLYQEFVPHTSIPLNSFVSSSEYGTIRLVIIKPTVFLFVCLFVFLFFSFFFFLFSFFFFCGRVGRWGVESINYISQSHFPTLPQKKKKKEKKKKEKEKKKSELFLTV